LEREQGSERHAERQTDRERVGKNLATLNFVVSCPFRGFPFERTAICGRVLSRDEKLLEWRPLGLFAPSWLVVVGEHRGQKMIFEILMKDDGRFPAVS